MGFVSPIIAGALRDLAAEAPMRLRVSGDCMAPLLADGAMIMVARRRFYGPGDAVVMYGVDGRLLIHRLLGGYFSAGGWRWLTQADNADWPDVAAPQARMIGKVCGGDCSPLLIQPPLAHRLSALRQFVWFGLKRLRGAQHHLR